MSEFSSAESGARLHLESECPFPLAARNVGYNALLAGVGLNYLTGIRNVAFTPNALTSIVSYNPYSP